MEPLAPLDADGRDLAIGDWVRVIAVPVSVSTMPSESKEAFSKAVGHTFQIAEFDGYGFVEIDFWPKLGYDSIWLEPYLVRRTRRYKKLSKSFRKRLEILCAPKPLRHELKFEITLVPNVDLEGFGDELLNFATEGGMAAWPEQRKLSGSVYANVEEPEAMKTLFEARAHAENSEKVESASFKIIEAEI